MSCSLKELFRYEYIFTEFPVIRNNKGIIFTPRAELKLAYNPVLCTAYYFLDNCFLFVTVSIFNYRYFYSITQQSCLKVTFLNRQNAFAFFNSYFRCEIILIIKNNFTYIENIFFT